jgi:hypothetical protein
MTAEHLAVYGRQITGLLQEARDLASVPVAQRDTDDYRDRLAAFHALKARLLTGPTERDQGR